MGGVRAAGRNIARQNSGTPANGKRLKMATRCQAAERQNGNAQPPGKTHQNGKHHKNSNAATPTRDIKLAKLTAMAKLHRAAKHNMAQNGTTLEANQAENTSHLFSLGFALSTLHFLHSWPHPSSLHHSPHPFAKTIQTESPWPNSWMAKDDRTWMPDGSF